MDLHLARGSEDEAPQRDPSEFVASAGLRRWSRLRSKTSPFGQGSYGANFVNWEGKYRCNTHMFSSSSSSSTDLHLVFKTQREDFFAGLTAATVKQKSRSHSSGLSWKCKPSRPQSNLNTLKSPKMRRVMTELDPLDHRVLKIPTWVGPCLSNFCISKSMRKSLRHQNLPSGGQWRTNCKHKIFGEFSKRNQRDQRSEEELLIVEHLPLQWPDTSDSPSSEPFASGSSTACHPSTHRPRCGDQ